MNDAEPHAQMPLVQMQRDRYEEMLRAQLGDVVADAVMRSADAVLQDHAMGDASSIRSGFTVETVADADRRTASLNIARFDAEQEARERAAAAESPRRGDQKRGPGVGTPPSSPDNVVFFDADQSALSSSSAAAGGTAKPSPRPLSSRGPRHGVDIVRITQFAAIYRSMPNGWRERMRSSPRFDLLEVRELADMLMARSRGGVGGGEHTPSVSVPKEAMLDAVRALWPTRATDGHMVVNTAFDVLDFGASGQVDLDELFFFESLFAGAELSPKMRQVRRGTL